MLTLPLLTKRHKQSWLLFKWSVFPRSLWVMPAPHHIFLRKPLQIAESRFLQAGRPSCHPVIGVKSLRANAKKGRALGIIYSAVND